MSGGDPPDRSSATRLDVRECRRGELLWLRADGPGWRAAFSSRLGGVSRGPFATLNLSLAVGDDRCAVLENRRRLATAAGYPGSRLIVARQVHGVEVVRVGDEDAGRGSRRQADALPDTDGMWTTAPALPLSVGVADCVPVVLVAGAGGRASAVAVVHAGWRGMLAGIVTQGVERLSAAGPTMAAVIGPSIGPCCFAVGNDVGHRFSRAYPGSVSGGHVDLSCVASRQLESAGVLPSRIVRTGICTVCDDRFFSHRRDCGCSGRQAAVVWLEPASSGWSGDVD